MQTMFERIIDISVQTLGIDNGLEFVEKEFLNVCSKDEIIMHHNCISRPHLSGVVERIN